MTNNQNQNPSQGQGQKSQPQSQQDQKYDPNKKVQQNRDDETKKPSSGTY